MDTLSHGLWAGALFKAINKKRKKKLSVFKAGLWAMFPDLIAFAIPLVIMGVMLLMGLNLYDLPSGARQVLSYYVGIMYTVSHSFFIFAFVYASVFLILKRHVWEMFGWALHIIMDIPTHPIDFYPTKFFWPITNYAYGGISWKTPTFMIINVVLLVIVFYVLKEKKKRKTTNNEHVS